MPTNAYDQGLDRNRANHTALSPISFLERSARVYPDRVSLIHGDTRFTWAQTYARCRRLASALAQRGVRVGDTVAAMLPNTPPMFEAHFGVPMLGAVLNTLNTRLDARSHRLHARPRRSQGAADRPRVLAPHRAGTGADEAAPPAGD